MNKSYLLLTTELDSLKDPLTDLLQDIDKQRVSMMMELERQMINNRQLIQTSQKLSTQVAANKRQDSQGR